MTAESNLLPRIFLPPAEYVSAADINEGYFVRSSNAPYNSPLLAA